MTKSKLDTEMDLVKKSRIFVYSDSIALPRSFPEKLDWEETWVQLLKKRFSEVIFLSLGGGKIS